MRAGPPTAPAAEPRVVSPLSVRFLIPLLLAAFALSGCKRNEEAYLRSIVASVGPAKLVSDAATLASQPDTNEGFPVPESSLPASFRAFAPVETLRYGQQYIIVTSRFLQHRVGVAVQPVDYPQPIAVGNDRYIRIAPGVYFHES